ncbi:hypothetical protein, partial [Pseudomonas aeruginosa]|uniref:hypothetical protein n=1 Tax=Pseudomonas aeruginosa TaxID=287 RepID=UPI001E4EB3FD
LRVKSADFAKSGSLFQSFLSFSAHAKNPRQRESSHHSSPLIQINSKGDTSSRTIIITITTSYRFYITTGSSLQPEI